MMTHERVSRAIDPKAWAWIDMVENDPAPDPMNRQTAANLRDRLLKQADDAMEAMREPPVPGMERFLPNRPFRKMDL